jgi:hypothetical protein
MPRLFPETKDEMRSTKVSEEDMGRELGTRRVSVPVDDSAAPAHAGLVPVGMYGKPDWVGHLDNHVVIFPLSPLRAMTESAFSSSAQAVIQRPVVIDENETHVQLSDEQFRDYYELEWTTNEIISKDYKRVSTLLLM